MEYRLPNMKHDATVCQEIGLSAGQTTWSIGHRTEGDDVVLTLPDGVITMAQLDAIAALHPRPEVRVDRQAGLRAAWAAATTATQRFKVIAEALALE